MNYKKQSLLFVVGLAICSLYARSDFIGPAVQASGSEDIDRPETPPEPTVSVDTDVANE